MRPERKVFAGRRDELAEMEGALADALARRARIVTVSGEPGVGKSTLIDEFATRADRRGVGVVWAQCSELGGAPPFWPWIQIVRTLLADASVADALDPAVRDTLSRLALQPGAGAGGGGGPGADQARFALFDSVTRLLMHAGEVRARVLAIEDVHAADPASLQLLRFAGQHVRDARCVLVVTYREHEATTRPETAEILAQLPAHTTRIRLDGLPREDLAVLVEAITGSPPEGHTVEAVHDHTAGNPFFTETLVRMLVRDRAMSSLDAGSDVRLPATVVEVITARVARLPDEVRRTLTLLAAVGRAFDRRLAGSLAGDATAAQYAIDLAQKDRLVEQTDEAGSRFRFVHALVPAALVDGLPIAEREQIHATVAMALSDLHAADADPPLADLAHHYGRAGEQYVVEAFQYARAAGDRAWRLLAYEDAAHLYESAVSLAEPAQADDGTLIDVLLAAARARLSLGQLEPGRAHAERAWELAERTGSPEGMGRAALTYASPGTSGGIVNESTVRLIGGALASIGDQHPALRAELRARLVSEVSFTMSDEASDTMMQEAADEARSTGDPTVIAATLHWLLGITTRPQYVPQGLAWATEIVEIARTKDDRAALAEALARRSIFLLILGRIDEYNADVAALRQIAEALPAPVHRWQVDVADACEALMHGDFARASALIDKTLQYAQEVPNALPSWQFQRFALTWEIGGIEEFEPLLVAFQQLRPGVGSMARAGVVFIKAQTGRHDEVRATIGPVIEELLERKPPWVWSLAVGWAADAAALADDGDAARLLRPALQPYADLQVIGPTGAVASYWGSMARHLANLSRVMGEPDAAVAYGERALEAHMRVRSPTFAARSRFELARSLFERARAEDVARGLVLLNEAAAAAQRLGMTTLAEQIAAFDPPAAPAGVPPPSGTSAVLEGEYWTITHAGTVTRLKDAKGLRYLVSLLEHPGQEIAALDLVTGSPRGRAPAIEEEMRPADAGPSDPVLDPRARAEYQRRLEQLEADIEEAREANDTGRAERLRDERDFLVDELRRALGLGGRARTLGTAPGEQARVAVTKGIKSVLRKIADADAELGRHLRATVRTGTFCSYSGDIEPTIAWAIRR